MSENQAVAMIYLNLFLKLSLVSILKRTQGGSNPRAKRLVRSVAHGELASARSDQPVCLLCLESHYFTHVPCMVSTEKKINWDKVYRTWAL
jgi:hypothetical protein